MTSVQSASVASSGSLTRNERLDRLPFNKAHRKLLVASGIGWAFDRHGRRFGVLRCGGHRG